MMLPNSICNPRAGGCTARTCASAIPWESEGQGYLVIPADIAVEAQAPVSHDQFLSASTEWIGAK